MRSRRLVSAQFSTASMIRCRRGTPSLSESSIFAFSFRFSFVFLDFHFLLWYNKSVFFCFWQNYTTETAKNQYPFLSVWHPFLSPERSRMSAESDKNVIQKGRRYMWLEKVIEAKKAQGLTTKTMSERSRLHLTERTITRILNRETKVPKIDTILDLGATVGLSAHQLFAETDLVPLDREEIDRLKSHVKELTAEIEILRLKVEYQADIIALYKRINETKPAE